MSAYSLFFSVTSNAVTLMEIGGAYGNVWGTGEVHAEFWWGDLRERVHL